MTSHKYTTDLTWSGRTTGYDDYDRRHDVSIGSTTLALSADAALPAGDLAREAGVTPSTASEHLHVLLEAELVRVSPHGRRRLYRLASADVSRAVEALQAIAPRVEVASLRAHRASRELHAGRTCYDHLAGDLGLRVSDLLLTAGVLTVLRVGDSVDPPDPFPTGHVVDALGVVPPSGRRAWARGCLDWTGRRAHVAGQVGTHVLRTMEARNWIQRRPDSRAVQLTPTGAEALARLESTTPTDMPR